ncbi:MAG: DUF2971 domain-containing protein [Acidobacteria bacterium]|nr:MAG: DUF2971 domain-containing protein [Acidobacteriota bacterium]
MLLSEFDKSAVDLANKALNKVLAFNIQREFGPKQAPPNGALYHYSTADGLKGIIEKNELWASSAYFLNDWTEITYGCGLVTEVLDNWILKNPGPETSLALDFAQQLRQRFGEDLLKGKVIEPIYLACFCEDDNLLSQWRNYGQSGGYSLGFAVPAPDLTTGQGFKPEPNIYTSKWVKVEYDRSEQVKKCNAVLEPVLTAFDNPDVARAVTTVMDHPLVGYSKILGVIRDMLFEEIIGFKNRAFEVEKEWRVVVRRRELLKQGSDDGGRTPIPVYFRSLEGGLVPYVKLIPTDPAKKLPIVSVRSGPTLEKATASMVITMLLHRNGFSNVRVQGSDIPVRL